MLTGCSPSRAWRPLAVVVVTFHNFLRAPALSSWNSAGGGGAREGGLPLLAQQPVCVDVFLSVWILILSNVIAIPGFLCYCHCHLARDKQLARCQGGEGGRWTLMCVPTVGPGGPMTLGKLGSFLGSPSKP